MMTAAARVGDELDSVFDNRRSQSGQQAEIEGLRGSLTSSSLRQ